MDQTAIDHELNFWKGFVQTERFLVGWCGHHKTPELRDRVAEFILSVPHHKVLDVGSGVVSILNGTVPKENLTAADPLGDHYKTIFDYASHGIDAPLAYRAEDIPFVDEFDVVHISNALDHSQEPVAAFAKLLEAVKPGGYLIVQGFENEGKFENWQGFHQWNIELAEPYEQADIPYSTLYLTSKDGQEQVLSAVAEESHRYDLEGGKTWFVWIEKKPEVTNE
jgi:SAM-dependent methyltransferase